MLRVSIGRSAGFVMFAVLSSLFVAAAPAQDAPTLRFEITVSPKFSRENLTGHVYLMLAEDLVGEPRDKLFNLPMKGYIFKKEFVDLAPTESVIIDASSAGYPARLDQIPALRYNVQAVLDLNPNDYEFTRAHGNGRSRIQRLDLEYETTGTVNLTVDTEIIRNKLRDVARVHYEEIESRIVGREIGRRFFVTAAVVFPPTYTVKSKRKYPVQYWIPALGTGARGALHYFQSRGIFNREFEMRDEHDNFIYVLLDAHARNGHHGWANSVNNGPFLKSVFEEIIPKIEANNPIIPDPKARYLVGHGLGGWSALWLQTNRPRFFSGTWALAPDPVDFRDFFGLDIYAPNENAFKDVRGVVRPLARDEGKMVISIKEQADYEAVVGNGNLFQSFEAIFGPSGTNGRPRPLFDSDTGTIDRSVATHWERYDLRKNMEKKWLEIGDHLQGKLHIYVGEKDNYYLARPALLLRESLQARNSDAKIEILPALDHTSIDSREMHKRLQSEISIKWRQNAADVRFKEPEVSEAKRKKRGRTFPLGRKKRQ